MSIDHSNFDVSIIRVALPTSSSTSGTSTLTVDPASCGATTLPWEEDEDEQPFMNRAARRKQRRKQRRR